MILLKIVCYFGLDALCIIAKVHLILVEHYILGIFFKLKVFSVFFLLTLFQDFIRLPFPYLFQFQVLLICEHNFFCFFFLFQIPNRAKDT